MLRKIFPFLVAIFLTGIALFRVEFSPSLISSAGGGRETLSLPLLDQPFYFLGKGKQSFAFVSEDGQFVLKFFNKKYFRVPWYAFFREQEIAKRAKREKFFKESYLIANRFLQNQTGLVHCHFEKTKGLPKVNLKDRTSRDFTVDLNEVSFVLQKRGKPFYPTLEAIYETGGKEAFSEVFRNFFEMIAHRISLSIEDGDHDVEHNYGFLEGKLFQLDPGRLLIGDFSKDKKISHEWWAATHAFRKWLEKKHPDTLSIFDELQKEYQNR